MRGGLDPQGPVAAEIAGLWWVLFWLGLAVFVVFGAVLTVALLRGRARRGEGLPEPHERDENPAEQARYIRRWVIALGVVMTSVVLIVVLAFTIAVMRDLPDRAPEAFRVDLVAEQFFWTATYPTHGITTRDVVRIPAGRPVELHITSADVIHSFWVPALAGKLDALPDRTNTLVLQADEPGTFRGQCAEFCGLYHAKMELTVVAMEPDELAVWLDAAR